MAKVIGVKFKNSGKSYFFDPLDFDVHKDDHVIVETGKGIDYGFVVSEIREIAEEKLFQPLKPILRKATERDEAQVAENHEKEKEAFRICQEKVRAHNLDMKLTEAEYAFDNSKILFYFTSEGYVDFRELVKDLAGIFRTRIELRQIGVRDEARAIGGLGACGRPMCCATYLADFVPVSIKMAKEQNLPLNPTKISGVCGRLMCCLKNEEETYEELNKTMPAVGDIVEGNDGLQGEVFSTNVLRQLVKVLVEEGDEKELHEYNAEQITIIRRRKGKKNTGIKPEDGIDEKQLAALEDRADNSGEEKKREKREKKDNRENRENRGENRGDNRDNRENHEENRGENRENREAGEYQNGKDRRDNKDHDNRENNRENNRDYNRDNDRDSNRDNNKDNSNKENNKDGNKENRGENREGGHKNRNRHNRNNDRRDRNPENKPNGGEGKNPEARANVNKGNDNAENGGNNSGNGGNNSANGGNNGGNGGNGGNHHHRRHFNKNHGKNREGQNDRNTNAETK